MKTRVSHLFQQHFGSTPDFRLYSAPGRINLIGEHTDYNGGFVFPGAIRCGILAAIRPNGLDRVRLFSADKQEGSEFSILTDELPRQEWARYVFGVCREMLKRGYQVLPFDAVFAGDVPIGLGLSSSAALESCFACALNDLFNHNAIPLMQLALIGQGAEHHYCGVMCGIMDQFASLHGKEGCLMRLDCRSMEFRYFPFSPQGYRLVLVNPGVKHALVNSPYNQRRQSCERVAAAIGVSTLRDASPDTLNSVAAAISQEDYRRARYVVGEIQRVLEVSDALERADYEAVGQCMYATHWGLSHDYEVSCEELDLLVQLAQKGGATGARIMGGGFGGCTINLVKESLFDAFVETTQRGYHDQYGSTPAILPAPIADGARRLE